MSTRIAFALSFLVAATAVVSPALAQQFVISTYAGGAPPPTPIAALNAAIGALGTTTDAAGNVYIVSGSQCVFKLDSNGTVTRVAGTGRPGYSGDGGPAINAQISIFVDSYGEYSAPSGPAIDSLGNLYIADFGNHRIRRISAAGIITTVAGTGTPGHSGDGGPATGAQLDGPQSVAIDSAGNLYIADMRNSRIRKVSADGIITTVAGNGTSGYSGDGGPATSAQLMAPQSLAIDSTGNLYIANSFDYNYVRKVSTAGIITTVAGGGYGGAEKVGDGGPATSAPFRILAGLAVDKVGNLYILDAGNSRVRKVSADGIITTVAGTGTYGYSGDGGPAINAQISSNWGLNGLTVDSAGNLYIGDAHRIRKISAAGIITTVVGNGPYVYSRGDGGPATSAQIVVGTLAIDTAGNLYIGGSGVRKVSADGIITTVVDNDSSGFSAGALAVDSAGNLYIADIASFRVRKVSADGIITTVAGNGGQGYSGDGGPATNAQIGRPSGLAVDSAGNLYIAIFNFATQRVEPNYRVRKVSPAGIITTVAGNGTFGFSGDGGPATSAQLRDPSGLAVDAAGNLYIADATRVRKVSPAGIITTVAGDGIPGFSGDGGPATEARLMPTSLAVDSTGNLYIANNEDARVRMVSPSGIITTVAGNGSPGYSGDGGPATSAQFSMYCSLAVDSSGNLYLADQVYAAVRLLQPLSSSIDVRAVTNAASNLSGPIAPGEIVVIRGSQLGPAQLVSAAAGSGGLYATQLAGTTVQFNGTPAPLIYTWATQLAAVVPDSVSGGTAQVIVAYQSRSSAVLPVVVAASAPGVFTLDSSGKGQAFGLNQDGTFNTAAFPAKLGDVISLYVTGLGQTGGPMIVTIGGQPATSTVIGKVAGATQMDLKIPDSIQTGSAVPVVVQVGNTSSQAGVTIAVR